MPFARSSGMSTTHEPDVHETEIIDRPVVEHRIERVEHVTEPTTRVNAKPDAYAPVWTTTPVVTLLFTVLEVLLLVRAADEPPEDLPVAGLRKLTDEPHRLRPQRFAELLRDRVGDGALERGVDRGARLRDREHDDRLALQLIGDADRGGLAHRRVRD